MLNNLHKISFGIYGQIFFTFFYILFLSSLGFLINIPITKFHLPVSFILGVLTTFLLMGIKDRNSFFISLLILIILSGCSYYMSIYFYDFSWDGMAYHQDAIVKLANGWNPIYEPSHSIFSNWIEPYQKGVEIIQATIYSFTGKIESGKFYNFMVFTSTFLILIDALKIYITPLFTRFLLAFLSVCCPIVLVQLFTYYIDFTYYLLTLSIICALALIFNYKTKKLYFVLIALSVLVCSLKFSTVPTFVIICSATIFYLFWRKKKEFIKPIFISFLSIFLLCIITNYNPFITNISAGQHIFHPLMGKEKIDIMKDNSPPYIYGKNRFEKFYHSTVSIISNKHQTIDGIPATKISKLPFSIKEGEVDNLKIPDVRLSGFGVFYSGILIITIVILISIPLVYFLDKRKRLKSHKELFFTFYFLIGVLLVTVILNPEMWWARYVPQLWLISILSLLMIWKINLKYFKAIKYFLFFSMFFNILIHGHKVLEFEIKSTDEVRTLLKNLKDENAKIKIDENFFVNLHLRLKENNIEYVRDTIEGKSFAMPGSFGDVNMQEITNLEKFDTLKLKDISTNNELNLYNFLKDHHNETIIIVAKDEASQGISEEEKEKIKQNFGLNFKDLKFRGSYVAVISKGKLILEEINNNEAIEIRNNSILKKLGIDKISSAGYTIGDFSSVKINRSELSLNKRGLNIVLIKNDNDFYLLNVDSFQTTKVDTLVYKPTFINEK